MYIFEAFLGHDHEHGHDHGHSHGGIHPEDQIDKIEKFNEEKKPQSSKLKNDLKSNS